MKHKYLQEDATFSLKSPYAPSGDQPVAIEGLVRSISAGNRFQILHGVTGTGKTFTMANVINRLQRPVLVIAPNKTLAAQLYQEFKEFFPENRVRYFVSYYDYYQPEAYIPSTDTYIEKDSAINEEIDKMRHSATRALLEARDTIIVASVSCIYGLGAPEEYFNLMLFIETGQEYPRNAFLKKLVELQYSRSEVEFKRGTFRVRGETVDIFPSDQDSVAFRVLFFGDEIEEIREIDPVTGSTLRKVNAAAVYPLSHFLTGKEAVEKAIVSIKKELKVQVKVLEREGKLLESQRLEQRTLYDVELLEEVGFCPGIENYSRHLAGRVPGAAPTTLIDYFPDDYLVVIDESHVTVPQIRGMYRGDRARKSNLVAHGFRLPSALDNRPLNDDEFWDRVGQVVCVSATPGDWELQHTDKISIIPQINRPTGLLDPLVDIRPATNQVDDLINEIHPTIDRGNRVLVTTLTKKMAENLTQYLRETGIDCRYLHSDITTVERVEILRGLRRGDFDVLIGINLLREGLDLVEVELVAILDADKEGFLRSHRSLIQTMGRAARNLEGRVIMYADRETDSMKRAIGEAHRRREIQAEFNRLHGIVPASAKRELETSLVEGADESAVQDSQGGTSHAVREQLVTYLPLLDDPRRLGRELESLKKQMFDAAAERKYEKAAQLRDTIEALRDLMVTRTLPGG